MQKEGMNSGCTIKDGSDGEKTDQLSYRISNTR